MRHEEIIEFEKAMWEGNDGLEKGILSSANGAYEQMCTKRGTREDDMIHEDSMHGKILSFKHSAR